MSSAGGDELDRGTRLERDERARLVEQREEPLTATDWFFSHAVRMRAAYRPEPALSDDEPDGEPRGLATGDDLA